MCVQPISTRGERARQQILTAILTAALLVCCGVLAPRVSAQSTQDSASSSSGVNKSQATFNVTDDTINPNQPIKPDFVISVSVVGETEPSSNYPVDQSGNVGIKYAGIATPVHVAGLTPAQAQHAISEFLKTYIKNPQVTVTIATIPRPEVFVGGAVHNTGIALISSDTTLADVLSRAEWTDKADLSQVRVTSTHKIGDKEEKTVKLYHFDRYVQVSENAVPDETQNPTLHDKDKIFVPFQTLPGSGTVSVYGEVGKPQRDIPLPAGQSMTVREAINLAGDTLPDANRKAVMIRRPSLDKPLIIDLDQAEQGDPVFNIALKADDSIYVEKLQDNAFVLVDGGFIKPGKYVYDKRTTLTQAVMEAGGPAPFAKVKEGVIFRHPNNDAKNTRQIAFNWTQIQKGKAQDIELQPGDSIFIPTGIQPRPPVDFFSVLGGLGSAAYIYNTLAGHWIAYLGF